MTLAITIPVLDVDVYLSTDREDARTWLREHGSDADQVDAGDRGFCVVATDARGAQRWLICVFERGEAALPIVVHECVHLAGMTCRRVGIPRWSHGRTNSSPTSRRGWSQRCCAWRQSWAPGRRVPPGFPQILFRPDCRAAGPSPRPRKYWVPAGTCGNPAGTVCETRVDSRALSYTSRNDREQ